MTDYIAGWIPFVIWVIGFIMTVGTTILIPRVTRAILLKRKLDNLWQLVCVGPNISIETMGLAITNGSPVERVPPVIILYSAGKQLKSKEFLKALEYFGGHVEGT